MNFNLDAVKKEIETAQKVGEAQVAGLRALASTQLTTPVVAVITAELGKRTSRYDLLSDVVRAIENLEAAGKALEADGYPTVGQAVMDKALFAELQEKVNATTGAMSAFTVGG